jgi:flagellar biosynthetic protein FlhB
MCLRASVAILVLAILDYGFQRWVFERDLRMTKSELKEELRRMEGDPRMKERRRKVQQQIAYQRMMRDVPKASVVVTNPTQIAVAIRYDDSEMAAPRVVAKGEGYIAQRIREVAMENGVPVVERRELARALYGAVEIGQEIPPQFYKTVAELLAYVYRLTGSRAPGGFGRPEEMVGGRR